MDFLVTLFYGLLTLAACLIARRGGVHLYRASLVLASLYFATNVMVYALSPHAQFYPFMDCFSGILFAVMWSKTRLTWLALLAGTFLIDGAGHIWHNTLPAPQVYATYGYDLFLNLVYVLQLSIVSVPGAIAAAKRGAEK